MPPVNEDKLEKDEAAAEAQPVNPGDAFDAAWKELGESPQDHEGDDGDDNDDAPDDEGGGEEGQDGADDSGDHEGNDPEAEEPEGDEPENDTEDASKQPTKEDIQKVIADLKMWQGRLRVARKDYETSEARLADLNKQIDDAKTQLDDLKDQVEKAKTARPKQESPQEDFLSALSRDEREAFEQTLEEFPHLAKGLEAMSAAQARKIIDEVMPGLRKEIIEKDVAPVVSEASETAKAASIDQHWRYIRSHHKDAEEIVRSEGFEEWRNSLPDEDFQKYRTVCQGGTAEEVVDMLDHFKRDQSGSADNSQPQESSAEEDPPQTPKESKSGTSAKREQQRAAGVAVRRRSTPVTGRPTLPPKDDFEGGWDHFASADKP